MIQRISRTLILLAVSGLTFSTVRLQAQQTTTTPNANQQPKPNRPAAAPAGTIPPAFQAGIKAMLNAKANLEKAGDKWGGHRIKAIALIDKALDACGQTQTKGHGEMKSGPTDDMTLIQSAITQLTTAQNDFKNAKNPWGGRRDTALPLITQALNELKLAGASSHGPTVSNP